MNKRTFAAALLLSALPLLALAGPVSFDKGDFKAAQTITRSGKTLVRVKLTKSGKSKIRKLNQEAAAGPTTVHSEIAGVETNMRLREPIRGPGLEMGPYSDADAHRVVDEINRP